MDIAIDEKIMDEETWKDFLRFMFSAMEDSEAENKEK